MLFPRYRVEVVNNQEVSPPKLIFCIPHHYTPHKNHCHRYNLIPLKNSNMHLFFHSNEIDSDLEYNHLPGFIKSLKIPCCHKFHLLDCTVRLFLKYLHQSIPRLISNLVSSKNKALIKVFHLEKSLERSRHLNLMLPIYISIRIDLG